MSKRNMREAMNPLHPEAYGSSPKRPASRRPDPSSSPMRTIDLTGFWCRKGDPDYAAAAEATGEKHGQDVYWFRRGVNRMMWDELEGFARNSQREIKFDPKQDDTAVKKYTVVNEDAAADLEAVMKPFFGAKDAAVKKGVAINHVAAAELESEEMVDKKSKGKSTRDARIRPAKSKKSEPFSDFSKIMVDEIEDIRVARREDIPALRTTLRSSGTKTSEDF
jgi:hypothetical protein